MSGVSRRALLGYSGSAAAGAALASAGTAQAADPAPAKADGADKSAAGAQTVETADGTQFTGSTSIGDIDAMMDISFSIRIENAPAAKQISPLEIAEALNKLAASRGWPRVTFYYQTSAALN
ncbi:hypothetical protein [Streptomyces venezuelae]|uniref:Secreted protein n=1 Tax=Streptomyces venezuelae TaxID=54571 RepID=A0A5P2BR61_STRVZ|nr:hypothetical protein [Streptomyces venezuelae]QES32460.1 hypothetical protein DEJ48_02730 [Streptomyces venezuelae]